MRSDFFFEMQRQNAIIQALQNYAFAEFTFYLFSQHCRMCYFVAEFSMLN